MAKERAAKQMAQAREVLRLPAEERVGAKHPAVAASVVANDAAAAAAAVDASTHHVHACNTAILVRARVRVRACARARAGGAPLPTCG